jgi:4-hydroxybenzoate polyprenyltransferase
MTFQKLSAKVENYLSLVKFSHTIFALPFALLGFSLATIHANDSLSLKLLALVILCMLFARNAAMSFNRWADRDIDEVNPRTAQREIPAQKIKHQSALLFCITNALLFVAATWFINPLCFYLSPIALIVCTRARACSCSHRRLPCGYRYFRLDTGYYFVFRIILGFRF